MFKINGHQMAFLQTLIEWEGCAASDNLPPQVSQKDNSARQTCKRRGWVTFDRHYWRITEAGCAAFERAKETLTIERSLT